MYETISHKSIFKHASELGLWMGLYLFLMSASLLLSVHCSFTSLLLLPLALGWPVVLWMLLKHMHRQTPSYRALSATWLAGIWINIFGALICAALTAAWIQLFQPDFISLYLEQCVAIASQPQLPAEYQNMGASMRNMLEGGHMPSSMQWVVSMIWLTAFSGAILSLIVSLVMNIRRPGDLNRYS